MSAMRIRAPVLCNERRLGAYGMHLNPYGNGGRGSHFRHFLAKRYVPQGFGGWWVAILTLYICGGKACQTGRKAGRGNAWNETGWG